VQSLLRRSAELSVVVIVCALSIKVLHSSTSKASNLHKRKQLSAASWAKQCSNLALACSVFSLLQAADQSFYDHISDVMGLYSLPQVQAVAAIISVLLIALVLFAAMHSYVNFIKRIDELERKIKFFGEEIHKFGIHAAYQVSC
jgi:cytochrome bd-type quinol oxidase subunit 2